MGNAETLSKTYNEAYQALRKYADQLIKEGKNAIVIFDNYAGNLKENKEERKYINELLTGLSGTQKIELVEKVKTDIYLEAERKAEETIDDKVSED